MKRFLVSVVMPAFNEERNIGQVISDTISIMNSLKMTYELIVVNDGSTDKTGTVASQYKVSVLMNERNIGKGYALREGIHHAHGDIIVTIDSDGAHRPKEIPNLLKYIYDGSDIVSGSRFLGYGRGWTSPVNMLGNSFFNLAIMVLTRRRITDSQTGFHAFKSSFLREINLESLGYEIESEITVKGLRNGFIFKEVPITCDERRNGVSKIRLLSDGFKILKTILKAGFTNAYH